MSNVCNVPLFSEENNDLSFLKETIKNSTLDNVSDNITSLLKEQASFATTEDNFENQEEYEDNILNNLIPNIINVIEKTWKVKLTPKSLQDITQKLQESFIKSKDSSFTEEEAPTTQTTKEKQNKKVNLSVRQLQNLFFKGEPVLIDFQTKQFRQQIKNHIIFNSSSKNRSLVYNQKSLNENLKQYKQTLYELIYNYCKQNNISVKQIKSYYNSNNEVRGEEILEAFMNYVVSLTTDERQTTLESDWENYTLGNIDKNSVSLLDAVNAYINLTKFDDLLKGSVGNFISINYKLDEPVNTVIVNNRKEIQYKYNFGRRKTNMSKDFREVMQSALDTMGNFSKFLIELIPRIDSKENITQIQFLNSLLHLKQAINKSTNTKFKQNLKSIHTKPKEAWKTILDDFSNLNSYEEFIKAGLTFEDVNIINSIHRFMYGKSAEEKKNSIYSLEKEIHNEIGYKELYPLTETLIGTIDSISDLTYLETRWNYETNMYDVGVKKKYFNNKQKLDLISSINEESSKPLSTKEREFYHISYLRGPFIFDIEGKTINISPKKSSEWGIFDPEINVQIDNKSIDSYFKNINLNGVSNRQSLLQTQSGIEKEFIELLRFIDKALNTGFSINAEGLQKFHIFKLNHPNAIKDLVSAAAKVYVVKDLNRKFRESIENKEINPDTKSIYTELDLRIWLKYNASQVPIIQFTKDQNDYNKKYFKTTLGVTRFNPILYNESWIDDLGDATTILLGESLKATTKDFNRNNVPNYSPAYLGAEIAEIVDNDVKSETGQYLLFAGKSNLIKGVMIDTDVKVSNGKHKAVSDMTESELQYHFFVNKFLIPFKSGIFYSQPTVYSDKKKFVNYAVSLTDLNLKSNEEIIQKIQETQGRYYHKIFDNILEDYSKIFGTKNVKIINQELHKLTLSELLSKVVEYNKQTGDKLELIQDLHYRNVDGQLGLNETLYYYDQFLFTDQLADILHKESINYVNTLLNSGVIFDSSTGFKEALNDVASSLKVRLRDWMSGDNLILAKIHNEDGSVTNVIAGEKIDPNLNIEVNPILERYVLLHNLINNNLKESLIGTDGIHKIKVKSPKISSELVSVLNINPNTSDLIDLQIAIKEFIDNIGRDMMEEPSDEEVELIKEALKIQDNINKQVRTLQSKAQNAQLKRTVTVPGTMRYYLQGTMTGILPTLRGAVIQDVHASVFNFEGNTKNDLEAHDGGAYLNPITAIFQNNSLQDSEVGDIIKPLWHVNLPRYGSKRLVKYAAHTMTNAVMRNSMFSEISMYRMFQKMTNIRWNNEYNTKDKNLLNQYRHRVDDNRVSFSDIVQTSGNLYFTIGNDTYQITDFGWDENGYYTKEQKVVINASSKKVSQVEGTTVKQYHYFDDNGKHYKTNGTKPEGTHTIDSIFELHSVLGGINSQSFVNGRFIYSDGSTLATAAILNMVSEPTEKYREAKKNKQDIQDTQEYFYQPLKYKMVDYLINQSAIKNGSGNINFREQYQNPDNELNDVLSEEPLRYVEMDTQRYGIQQDSEHEVDDEELTEMSQVISSIDAGGQHHDEVKELYTALGRLALTASKVELSRIKAFTNNKEDQNILYDLVGRILIEHLSFNRGQNGLAENLIDSIRKTFSLSSEHDLDEIKIPFSDQVIYSQVISTISSLLNKKSVKRKFPGTGQVMVPGYNIVQLWEFDEISYRFDDLVTEAKQSGITSTEIDPIEYNKAIVKTYLQQKQAEYAQNYTKVIPIKNDGTDYNEKFWENQLQDIEPIDVVQITVNGATLKPIKLDKIEDYYKFKQSPLQFLNLSPEDVQSLEIVKRIDIPRNLSPLKYSFTYKDSAGISHTKNVYDLWAVKDMYFALEEFKNSLDPSLSKYERSRLIEQEKIRLRNIEQNILNELDNGHYIDRNGNVFEVTSSNNREAEVFMSNIYKSKFGIEEGESLYDILKAGPSRFEINPLHLLPKETTYDLAFVKTNGQSTFISFDDNGILEISGQYKVKQSKFKNISKHYLVKQGDKIIDSTTQKEFEEFPTQTADGRSINSYVYMLDEDNVEVIPIGIEIDVSNEIEFDGENYIDKKTKKPISNREFTQKDGKILEYIQFVEKKTIKPKFSDKYSIYNVKSNLINQLLGSYSKNIIKNLYDQDSYSYIMPSRYINPNTSKTLLKSLEYLEKQSIDPATQDYLHKLQAGISFSLKGNNLEGVLVTIKNYSSYFKDYNKVHAERVFNSFKESLNFISSRIPAQSLQSFMKMKVVGFTQSRANQAYVSHWQTWLQGSDYDIDKSYMLGNEIDSNGLYQAWSSLFDYNFLEESKKLPFPTGVTCYTANEPIVGLSIEKYLQEYLNAKNKGEQLEVLNDLIRFINDQNQDNVQIAWFEDDKQSERGKLISLINKHNNPTFSLKKSEASLKNFISNKLQKIIQSPKNFIGSHSPITMDDLHEAADSSQNVGEEWTTMNPGYIPLMQTQNMVGKKGVGIAANGQKASFIWKYWMTDSINNNNPYREYVQFPKDLSLSRIEGRFGGTPQQRVIKRLPDINMYNASEEDKSFFEFNDNHYIPSDQMSSQMISAATDNAKELILDRINANTDLSKMYMYLITLGFDVKDIVSFMTNPVINFIARNSVSNIFTDTQYRVEDVANFVINTINAKLNPTAKPLPTPSIRKYTFVLSDKLKTILSKVDNLEEALADIQEFKKVYKLSQEFSNLGRLLGMNQGVPTTKEKLMGFKHFIRSIINQREMEVGVLKRENNNIVPDKVKIEDLIPEHLRYLVDNFDADEFLSNEDYRKDVIDYYEQIKGSVNIFAVIEGTPQFKSILDIANIVNIIDKEAIAKSKAMDIIYKKILKSYPYTSSDYASQLLPVLNQVLIQDFFEKNSFSIPVLEGWNYIDKKWDLQKFNENGNLIIGGNNYGLDINAQCSSFHYIMDNYIIPQLKSGELKIGDKIIDLRNNAFIQNLVISKDQNFTKYKVNVDMRAIKNNPESKVVLRNILKGMKELQNYQFGNSNLLNIFMAYSLVVDQNQTGSDRMTDLFSEFISEYQISNNLMLDYFKHIGSIDFNKSDFINKIENYSVNDFLISLALPVSNRKGHNEPVIKEFNEDGTISYLYSIGYSNYKDYGNLLPLKTGESHNEKILRQARREQYGFGFIFSNSILDVIENLKQTNNPNLWVLTLSEVLSNGYVKLNIDCN